MKIVYLGAGEFGVPTLAQLSQRHEVALVVTQPDRPAGRHRRSTATPVGQWAEQVGLPLVKTADCNEPAVMQAVRRVQPDVMVVIAFGQYIKSALAGLASMGAVNLHGSLLPKYRGAGPIHWAIMNGERQTGNTVIRVAPKMDAGAMLGRQQTPIDPRETAGELHDRLAAMGPELMLKVLDELAAGTAVPVEQDERQATVAPKLSRADGWVDWGESAGAVRCRVHGLTPWPGVKARWVDEQGRAGDALLVRRVDVTGEPDHAVRPGTLLAGGLIACGASAVRLVEVQPPGRRAMSWADYQRGHPVAVGALLISEPP